MKCLQQKRNKNQVLTIPRSVDKWDNNNDSPVHVSFKIDNIKINNSKNKTTQCTELNCFHALSIVERFIVFTMFSRAQAIVTGPIPPGTGVR